MNRRLRKNSSRIETINNGATASIIERYLSEKKYPEMVDQELRRDEAINSDNERYYRHELSILKALGAKPIDKEDESIKRLHALIHAHGDLRMMQTLRAIQGAAPIPEDPPDEGNERTGGGMQLTPGTGVKVQLGVLIAAVIAITGWVNTYIEKSSQDATNKALIAKSIDDNSQALINLSKSVEETQKNQKILEQGLRDYQEEASRIAANQSQIIKNHDELKQMIESIRRR